MTYCHVTYQTNKYLDEMGYWEQMDEAYAESEQYQEDLEEFDGTEEEYWNSYAYENAVEAYARRLEDEAY